MEVNLVINYYKDRNAARFSELTTCMIANMKNPEIDSMQIITTQADMDGLQRLIDVVGTDKVIPIILERRPSFHNYFNYTLQYPDAINIVANTDIIFDLDSLKKLKKWDWKNYCLALTRWDFLDNDLSINSATYYDHPDSQDAWMVKGSFPILPDAGFTLGIAGCDNKLCHLLSAHYEVVNPSHDIKTYHYHLTNLRNYMTGNTQQTLVRLSPPYKILPPIPLNTL